MSLQVVKETDFQFKGLERKYTGKVRDVYAFEDKLAMVATDRISAFDVVLPRAIPFKGQVLNQIAAKFLGMTSDIVPNWVEAVPDPNVTVGKKCEPFAIEMVVRGYLVGHAWREYKAGKRILCGVQMPDGMNENDKFPSPIITPTTKAMEGHDMDISREEILSQGIVEVKDYEQLEKHTLSLFDAGSRYAQDKGLILVDTKYEFGKIGDDILLIDEIHTPDSSRYFYADTYQEYQTKKIPQRQLSKEFVRQWLIENGFQGKEGQTVPEMSDDFVTSVSDRYIELYEHITGEKFERRESSDIIKQIKANIEQQIY